MSIGIVSLSSCSGCQVSLLDQKEILTTILDEVAYATTLLDKRELTDVEFCFVEGAVRTTRDLELLVDARKKSKTLVALGTCAGFGGIQALGNTMLTHELLGRVVGSEKNPFEAAPKLNPQVQAIDYYVEVEFYIPGCPPSTSVLQRALPAVLSGEEIEPTEEHRLPVCAECDRRIQHVEVDHFEDLSVPDKEICLLSQGYFCLGSVTRGGCSAQCPETNMPCSGCRGPTDRVLTKPTHTILRDFVKRVAHFSGREETEIEKEIRAIPWRFYPFTFGSESLRRKPHSDILKHQAHIREEE